MKRFLLLAGFAALLWQTHAWTRNNPVPADERTFEASRRGFQPLDTAGPLTRDDFVRLLLRRRGDFRLPLTVNYRVWRRADPPDLWELELPGVIKIRIAEGAVVSSYVDAGDLVTAGVLFNQPVVVRNDLDEAVDLQAVTQLGAARVVDRFRVEPGLSYYSLNAPPKGPGRATLQHHFSAGPESQRDADKPQTSLARTVEVVPTGLLRLRTREAGGPVHARVIAWGADGLAYAPDSGTLSKLTWTAGEPFFYSSGEDEIRLPAGPATLRAVRGFEYEPVEQTVEIVAGETVEADLELERFSDLAAEGWWGGDVHIHANYNDHEFITPEDVLLQALGEDLHIANLMVANSTGAQVHDEAYFEGKPHALSRPRCLLRWIEEMRNGNLYGHMCLPGIERLVYPLYTSFPGTPEPYDYPPNYAQAKGAQEAGGVASYAHPGYRFTDDPFTMSARELPVDLALGAVEAMDVLSNSNEAAGMPYWYELLNTGLRCAISAGSDSFTNRRHHWLPGGQRVYVQTGGPLDYREWVEGYRQGRSFATNGPILDFTVNGELPGSELELAPGESVAVRASVRSLTPLDGLEVVVNGEVIASAPGPARELELGTDVELDEGAWIAARALGPFDPLHVNDDGAFAHSSPVYARVDGRGASDPEAAQFFVAWIDRLLERVRSNERFADEAQRREVIGLFERAQAVYREMSRR